MINLERGEFLCPTCRSLANSLLPILESETSFAEEGGVKEDEILLSSWIEVVQKQLSSQYSKLPKHSALDESVNLFMDRVNQQLLGKDYLLKF